MAQSLADLWKTGMGAFVEPLVILVIGGQLEVHQEDEAGLDVSSFPLAVVAVDLISFVVVHCKNCQVFAFEHRILILQLSFF